MARRLLLAATEISTRKYLDSQLINMKKTRHIAIAGEDERSLLVRFAAGESNCTPVTSRLRSLIVIAAARHAHCLASTR